MNEAIGDKPRKQGDPIPARCSGGDEAQGVTYEFAGAYPIGSVWIDGHSEEEGWPAEVRVEYSLNGSDWKTVVGGGTGGESARYVRLLGASPADVKFVAGAGFAAEPADEWTAMFRRRQGWTGGDGIYSIPVSGNEAHGTAASTKTLFVFGDTFIGGVDSVTEQRDPATEMLNNTMAILEGGDPNPEKLRFVWRRTDRGDPNSAIVPATPMTSAIPGAYYWLQDAVSISGRYHGFPLVVGHDENGPEGFQFAVHGVTHISCALPADGPDLANVKQSDTPLYFKSTGGHTTYFGAAIMPNTNEAGMPDPDGYVYVYGLQHDGVHRLVAARALPEHIGDTSKWTYWDGRAWADRMEECAPIAPEVSCELSVSRMQGGPLDGKFVVACQLGGTTGNRLALYVGATPVGPFGPSIPLYYCPEPQEGLGIYSYNAKGHPHLSAPGELLMSYNVNTTSMEANMARGDIYRPRFVRVRPII